MIIFKLQSTSNADTFQQQLNQQIYRQRSVKVTEISTKAKEILNTHTPFSHNPFTNQEAPEYPKPLANSLPISQLRTLPTPPNEKH